MVALLGAVGEIDHGNFSIYILGAIIYVEDGQRYLFDKNADCRHIAIVGGIADHVISGVLVGRNVDGVVVVLGLKVGVGWIGSPLVSESAGAV